MYFLEDLIQKKRKKINHQHQFFAIFLSKAQTKIIKKNNPKTTNWLKRVVEMTKGAIITLIF